MTALEILATVADPAPPNGVTPLVRALWLDARGVRRSAPRTENADVVSWSLSLSLT
jgi:hypothetical protein